MPWGVGVDLSLRHGLGTYDLLLDQAGRTHSEIPEGERQVDVDHSKWDG